MKNLERRPKIDLSKCIGCHNCERRCPSEAMHVYLMEGYEKAQKAPCTSACPAHIDVPGYVGLAAKKRFEDAYHLIMKDNPFPSVCGRICTHPCEAKCNRGSREQAVAIKNIKRYVTDRVYQDGEANPLKPLEAKGKSVGIVGAGPSGMTCAYYLCLLGYEVHVYEEETFAGGVLAYGIPKYRLPKEILDREIKHIVDTGVHMHYACSLGRDITLEQMKEKHDAIYLATGTKFSKKMCVPGEEKCGVCHGIDFLHAVNTGQKAKTGKKAVVVGGGNTAIDVSRTLKRLGCEEVTILYRRTRRDMPAERIEIVEALEEGIQIRELAAPVEILGEDVVTGIRCIRMKTEQKGEDGRYSVSQIPGTEFDIECDMVVPAVSQYFDLPFIDQDAFRKNVVGRFVIDEDTSMTSQEGIFAGGDMTRGADVAIAAIADGKKSAIQIDRYLGGDGVLYTGPEIRTPKEQPADGMYGSRRPEEKYIPVDQRKNSFEEAIVGFDEEVIVAEAKRCFRCESNYKAVCDSEHCIDCGFCADFCPKDAITFVDRDEKKFLDVKIPPEHHEKILEMCRNAKVYPTHTCCVCYLITAADICEVILEGHTTVLDVIRRLGFASACAKYCPTNTARILAANGYKVEPMKYDKFYLDATVGIRDIPEDVAEQFPMQHVKEETKYYYKEEMMHDVDIWWPKEEK